MENNRFTSIKEMTNFVSAQTDYLKFTFIET